jgi:3-methyladenine DNA glycosylase Mpg
MKAAYAHAIATGYRFYSYGDSSLLFRAASHEAVASAILIRAVRQATFTFDMPPLRGAPAPEF